jgi:hypothetical protein
LGSFRSRKWTEAAIAYPFPSAKLPGAQVPADACLSGSKKSPGGRRGKHPVDLSNGYRR